ncbi:hypothetical protein [uncultured Desulfosarcina sp.]|uniref:hypothetical protein n=1 Tax=uncultured Desulfosarcina sp. TaxID=218289 RepID=UPI0029C60147|nr:hypothetical protein [uncultured Desulfosarcina sp.]
MKADKLIVALKKKFKSPTDTALANCLGITAVTLNRWRKNDDISTSQLASLIHRSVAKCEREARLFSIRPIVEYYEIEACDSLRGAKYEIFDTKLKKNKRYRAIRKVLENSNGIYVFYDSQCKALYVGKAKNQSLWQEMNNAFNRERETQKLLTVNHPSTGQSFSPAFEQPRQIENTYFFLNDLAHYFSAYEINNDLIDNIEAMLVRAFANTVLNARMEKIKLRQ